MFSTTDCSKENLGALFFQILRKNSGEHEESRINAYKSLRDSIIKKTLDECKELMPGATDQQWRSAMNLISEHA
jgi:hypothetical protein